MKKRFQETGIEIARPPSATVVLQGFQDKPEKPMSRARAG
jgi:hypothetical protein